MHKKNRVKSSKNERERELIVGNDELEGLATAATALTALTAIGGSCRSSGTVARLFTTMTK
jgi:hypothetical protein